jgi:high-affinity Fe2+/Pb2+ permease
MAAGLIVLREGIEVILATSGIVNTNPMGVILGSLLAIITLLALSNPIARLTSKINKKYIFQFCNWSFILMALYYLYEVVAQISVA